ncbi:MAG TPA: hypothetical protein VMV29_21375, partial [Ktedonobacterales bacterium]|nr:hypothetical protein [Ktedonobacterales bacterium]
ALSAAPVNKEAKPFIPGADQIQNQPTTYLEPLPWQIEQRYLSADEPHKAQAAPGQSAAATAHAHLASVEKASDLAEKPSDIRADRLRVMLAEKASGKLPDKPSHPFAPGDESSGRLLATSAGVMSPSVQASSALPPGGAYDSSAPTALVAPDASAAPTTGANASAPGADGAVTVDEATDADERNPAKRPDNAPESALRPTALAEIPDAVDASRMLPIVLTEAPTLRLAPPDPAVAGRLAQPTQPGDASDAAPSAVAADQSPMAAPATADPLSVADMATAPLEQTAPQLIPYPQLSMRAISEPNDVAWRLPDQLTQDFDNKDDESKGGNRAPGERAQASGLREYVAPTPPPPVMGGMAPDGARVDERVLGMVSALLGQPQLRASLPNEVIATLQLLLAPSPTADQIARGMSALAALRTVLEVTQAETLLAALPETLQTWYHAANWSASRLWLARHLDELPADAQAQLASSAAQLRAMGADAAAKTMERHARLLDAARRVGVDAAYHEVIGDEAFDAAATEETAVGDIAALKRIFDTVLAWIETPNWAASRDFLVAHPELLDDEAEAILARMYEVETEQRDQRDRQVIVDHQRLLRDARQLGVDAAYIARARRANAIRESVTSAQAQLAIPLMVWLETPDWNTSREYLRAHPTLLSDDGEVLLARLSATQATDHGRQSVADHQRLLGDARERGIDVAYDAFREERRERRHRA